MTSDLTGVGAVGSKLLEVINERVGANSEAKRLTKKLAAIGQGVEQIVTSTTEAGMLLKQLEITAEGGVNASLEVGDASHFEQLRARALTAFEQKLIREQRNSEQIVRYAVEAWEAEEAKEASISTNNEPKIDDDWMNRFFDSIRHINYEDIQQIWGKLLAGEIRQPGSFSLRTLQVLQNLSREEAQLFTALSKHAISGGGDVFVPFSFSVGGYGYMFKTPFYGDVLFRLDEAGLVYKDIHTITTNPHPMYTFRFQNRVLVIKPKVEYFSIPLDVVRFTKAGKELFSLVNVQQDIEYLTEFASVVTQRGVAQAYVGEFNGFNDEGETVVKNIQELTIFYD